ncbi:hypothetical protein G6F65_016125 [Rhizopus arrhizus]|nr:hypothetical protein G6F65_016125 [Rhizopus arrhizus]
MAGELVQRAAGELRLQGRVVQLVQRRRQAGREHHAPAAVGVLAPQLGTDEVADTAKAQAQRHQRRHEIHGVEEVQRVLARPPPAGAEHAQQAAVEAHAAIPDLEQQQRVVQEIAQRVEQHVADAPAQHHAEHGVEQQVGEAVGIDARQAPVGNALAAQQPGRGEAEQVPCG